MKTEETSARDQSGEANEARHEAVARLAYSYWLERGSPIGTPETDWFRAESSIGSDGQSHPGDGADPVTRLSAAAKVIGRALGEAAGAVLSVLGERLTSASEK